MKGFRFLTVTFISYILGVVAAYGGTQLSISEMPVWVKNLPINSEYVAPIGKISNGEVFLVNDVQVKLSDKDVSYFRRSVVRVIDQSGLRENSEIKITFDPTYQSLEIHNISIRRNGRLIDKADVNEFKLIQRETDLDQSIYDGSYTALLFLTDLRVGDELDVSYSINGKNHALDEFYYGEFSVEFSVPVATNHVRLISTMHLTHDAFGDKDVEVKTGKIGDEFIYEILQYNLQGKQPEAQYPAWYTHFSKVAFSSKASWDLIVQWGLKVYDPRTLVTPALQSLANQLSDSQATKIEQVRQLLRFVQDDIRYLGVEIGSGSLIPSYPSETYRRRFGDCKDKSVLLISLLKAIGVKAFPVFINADQTKNLLNGLPAITRFNHVIVGVIIEGVEHWVDPTISFEGGTINNAEASRYWYGLPIQSNSKGLSRVPAEGFSGQENGLDEMAKLSLLVEETFTVKGEGGDATSFNVKTTYQGVNANDYRRRLSRDGLKYIESKNLEYYEKYYPSVRQTGNMDVVDDRLNNTIIVQEWYEITEHWELLDNNVEYKIPFYTTELYWYLDKPDSKVRSSPFEIPFPANIRQVTRINLSSQWDIGNSFDNIDNKWFKLNLSETYENHVLTKIVGLKFKTDHVVSEELPDYIEAINQADNFLDLYLSYKTEIYDPEAFDVEDWYIFGYLAFLTLVLLVSTAGLLRPKNIYDADRLIFYPISISKFVLLNVCTANIYSIYWMYRNWEFLKTNKEQNIIPFLRALFSFIFLYDFYKRVKLVAESEGQIVSTGQSGMLFIAAVYFVATLLSTNAAWWWLAYLTGIACFIPALLIINRLNDKQSDAFMRNSHIGIFHVLFMFVVLHLAMLDVAARLNIIPNGRVVAGSELWNKELRYFQREGLLSRDEKLLYFYSAGMFSFKADGNGLTTRRVFSYWRDEYSGQLKMRSVSFNEIESIEEEFSDSIMADTVITVNSTSEEPLYLYLSIEDKGDRRFVDSLKRSIEASRNKKGDLL
ncbi:MAG: DUF3857 domain-containing transglutaminase family protein [Pseudomonadales bacterium]|nr:DUF3857 domain-containing transglutaminase family protein [Pseudomonadales bacterium]